MNSTITRFDVEKLDFNNVKSIKNMIKLLYNLTGSLYQTNQKLRLENEKLKDKLTRVIDSDIIQIRSN